MLALTTAIVALVGLPSDSTQAVASKYLELTFAQRYDDLRGLYADDVYFVDPTGDVWGGTLASGVRGADQVIALQKSWGLTSSAFLVDDQFVSGEYALFRGTLSWTTVSAPDGVTTDFVTLLRVKDGKVVERHDYGNYAAIHAGTDPAFQAANTAAAKRVGERYLQAYLDQRHSDMLAMYGPAPSFQDPTAAVFGLESGALYRGTEAIAAMLARAFQPISQFTFDFEDAWFSNRHAVFGGTIRYTLDGAALGTPTDVTFENSAVFVVTVQDGAVVAHRDYVDYSHFQDQLEAARSD
jgi:ketosteroid isomerase-like protein